MDSMKLAFQLLEFAAFILPALPESLYVRLTILFIYFVLHYFKAQLIYAKFKNRYCNPRDEIIPVETVTVDSFSSLDSKTL
jgi:hypothetical protein